MLLFISNIVFLIAHPKLLVVTLALRCNPTPRAILAEHLDEDFDTTNPAEQCSDDSEAECYGEPLSLQSPNLSLESISASRPLKQQSLLPNLPEVSTSAVISTPLAPKRCCKNLDPTELHSLSSPVHRTLTSRTDSSHAKNEPPFKGSHNVNLDQENTEPLDISSHFFDDDFLEEIV